MPGQIESFIRGNCHFYNFDISALPAPFGFFLFRYTISLSVPVSILLVEIGLLLGLGSPFNILNKDTPSLADHK